MAVQESLWERAFEIALARRLEAGEEATAWFDRHGSNPSNSSIPDHFACRLSRVVGFARRLETIASNPNIRLLEKPEYKRRWAMEPWDKQVDPALRGWLLTGLRTDRWFDDGRAYDGCGEHSRSRRRVLCRSALLWVRRFQRHYCCRAIETAGLTKQCPF